ncbi:DMT family transporter [Pseudaestuariivita rosea]|uniref:DMT family transporter n=1 Tax=Pseudaestuariivita rosea TaxID=2763263 RepID=UPI001ABAB4E6|nr:DMT family transporter [Pseudaestuariivita rosea]
MSAPVSNTKGALLALAAFGVFATHDAIVKVLGAQYAAFQIVFFSVLLGFPLVLLMLMRDKTRGDLRPKFPVWTAVRTLAVVITGASAFYAFSVLPLAQTYAILFASPLLITILAIPVLGEKVGIRRWLAVIVGLVGVIIVLRPGSAELSLGHAAALTAAIGGATASVIVRKIGRVERSAVLMVYPMVATFIVMACLLPFVYVPMPLVDFALSGVIAALAFIATLCLIAAYRNGEAVIVAPMQYSQIIWASAFGYFYFKEVVDVPTFVGAGIIIASGLYIVLREGRKNVSNTTPVLRTRTRFETGTNLRVGPILHSQDQEKTDTDA